MDYLFARWYIVSALPRQRVKELHVFENAVLAYAAKNRRTFYKTKTLPPLWWQEGALFLRGEFKKFWQTLRRNPEQINNFKCRFEAALKTAAPTFRPHIFLDDINLTHRCDLAINAPKSKARIASAKYPSPAL